MKRCPQCSRVETDDALAYCRVDGTALISDSLALDTEAGSAQIASGSAASEIDTSILPHTTNAGLRLKVPSSDLRPETGGNATQELTRRKHKAVVLTIALVILATLGASIYVLLPRKNIAAIDSIAVLPFVNQNHDPDADYLSEGLAESLIYRLSQLPNLKVSPTSSVFRYQGKEIDPIKIGNELGVSAVLSGRITQRGDNLTIGAELIDVRNNKLLWGEQYDRKSSELLATQREIAREIVDNLKLKVSPQERGLTKHYTESNEAYQLYMKGRFYWNKRTAGDLKKAIDEFQQAVTKDANFALAYAGLADSYVLLEEYAGTPSRETLPKARDAALRALEIDDSLAEAHASLGLINMNLWKFGESENQFKRAIELNPNYPTAHHWYSVYLDVQGRLDEAMNEIRRAEQLDPLSPVISDTVAEYYFLKGDIDAGVEQCKKIIDLNPNYPRVHSHLGWAYLKQGRQQEALDQLQRGVDLSGGASQQLAFLGYGYGLQGKRAEALSVLKELEQRYSKRESPAMYLAAVYGGIGDKDQAFAWLEKDFQARTGFLLLITSRPDFDTLRDDPRYLDLLRRIGLR